MKLNLIKFFLILSLFALALLTQSCRVHNYYLNKSVPNSQQVQKDGIFLYDLGSYDLDNSFSYIYKDTLRLVYKVWDSNSEDKNSFEIKIENLLNKPLYIDLSQSSFIRNGLSNPYRAYVNDLSTNFIPPRSYYILNVNPELNLMDKKYENIYQTINNSNSKQQSYVESSSPFVFRNLMTFSVSKDLSKSQILENKFWVEKIAIKKDIKKVSDLSHSEKQTYYRFEYKDIETYYTDQRQLAFTKNKFSLGKTLYTTLLWIPLNAATLCMWWVTFPEQAPKELFPEKDHY